jgi:hypothetical protein
MRKVKNGIAAVFMAVLFTACGNGDTGEGYHSTADSSGLNTTAGPTDSLTSATAGDRGNADSNTAGGATVNTNTSDTGGTNRR